MVDKIDTILIIISLIIIIIFFAYLLLCYRWNLYPYTIYERVPPSEDNTVIAAKRGEPFTPDEIEERRQYAANFCNAMANTYNFVTLYCSEESKFGLLDCEGII